MRLIPIIAFILFVNTTLAQELRCNISVNANRITGINQNIFRTMQMDLYDFINNRKWTNHTYTNNERIECSINIQLNRQISSDEYEGVITVQSKRTAYGSSYKTTVLNIRDENFRIKYQEYQSIEFTETANRDNLTSILAFYVYIILGFDYDTYSLSGGTEYFEKARQIVNDAQSFPVTYRGWRSFESDYNRYWIVDNMLNNTYSDYRLLLYNYHRKGLDAMSESVEAGRAEIAESLRLIQRIFRARSRLYINQLFFDTKSAELVSIFQESYPDEQERVILILKECDPSNAARYDRIKTSTEIQM